MPRILYTNPAGGGVGDVGGAGAVSTQTYVGPDGLVGFGLTNSTWASTPDNAVLDIVGDIDLVARATCNDWSILFNQGLIAKRFVALNDSFRWQIYNNKFMFIWTEDGSTTKQADATVSFSFADGQSAWLRMTLDVDNGAGGNTVTFYTAPDASTEPTSWTQIGAPVVTAGVTSIYSGTSLVEFGSNAGGANQIIGTLSQAIIRDGIGGTVVCDADFDAAQEDCLAFTESSVNALPVAITTRRYQVGVPNVQPRLAASTNNSANQTNYMPFQVLGPISVDMFVVESLGSAAGTLRVGIFAADTNMQPVGTCLAQGEIPYTITPTVYTKQITPVILPAGMYLIAINQTATSAWRVIQGGQTFIPLALGTASLFSTRVWVVETMVGPYTTGLPWNTSLAGVTPAVHPVFLRWKAA